MEFSRQGGRRILGVVPGVVTDNNHPNGEYKVKVKFPWIRSTDAGDDEDFLSNWARVATVMAGPGRGFWCLPEPEDEVLVAFEQGDIRRPIVIGSLWNEADLPPVGDEAPAASTTPDPQLGGGCVDLGIEASCVDTADEGANNRARFMHSRSGHTLLFDDGADQSDEKIVIKTARGHTIVLNDASGSEAIFIYSSTGKEYIHLDEANNNITIESVDGNIDILCKNGTFNLEAKEIKVESTTTASYKAADGTDMDTSGGDHKINASGEIVETASKIKLN